jgi:hypothetical protein
VARHDRTIPPGGEGKITLEIHTKGYEGTMQKTARVVTNDPARPQVTLTMKGQIWTPIRLNPRYVRLQGTVGEKVEQVVQVQAKKEEPLKVELASVSIPEKVQVALIEKEKGRIYELRVKNKVEGETSYGGTVNLTTNYPEKPEIAVRISGNVRPVVEVRPRALSFGRMSAERVRQAGSSHRLARRTVTVVLNKGSALEIEKVEVEKGLFEAGLKETGRKTMVQLLVEPLSEKLKEGPNTDTLRIHTNQEDGKVLEVPIRIDIFEQP